MAEYLTEYHRLNSEKAMNYLKNQGPVNIPEEVERHRQMHEAYRKQLQEKERNRQDIAEK